MRSHHCCPARDVPFESLMFPSKFRIETDPVSSTAPFPYTKFDFLLRLLERTLRSMQSTAIDEYAVSNEVKVKFRLHSR